MADLFIKQSKQYAEARPNYPLDLFQFIASKSPGRDLAWDVGTGTGQAARSLAGLYTTVIATDTSPKQLQHATKLPNIHYRQTPPTMSTAELDQTVAPPGTIDIVTVAQALHWFDLPSFYRNVRRVLKKPHGVIAAWCYLLPETSGPVDAALRRMLESYFGPYTEKAIELVNEKYKTIEFPFEAVDGEDSTGPVEFAAEMAMDLERYLTYLRSLSAYQKAEDEGVEILSGNVIEEFKEAWNDDDNGGRSEKIVRFPIYLRIGKVGNV